MAIINYEYNRLKTEKILIPLSIHKSNKEI